MINAHKLWVEYLGKIYEIFHRVDHTGRRINRWGTRDESKKEILTLGSQLQDAVKNIFVEIPTLRLRFTHSRFIVPSASKELYGTQVDDGGFAFDADVYVVRNYSEYKALQISLLPKILARDGGNSYRNLHVSWFRLNRFVYGRALTAKDKYPRIVTTITDAGSFPICNTTVDKGLNGLGDLTFMKETTDLPELRGSIYEYLKRLVFMRGFEARSPSAMFSTSNIVDSPLRDGLLDAFLKTHYLGNNAFKRRALRTAKTAVRGS